MLILHIEAFNNNKIINNFIEYEFTYNDYYDYTKSYFKSLFYSIYYIMDQS